MDKFESYIKEQFDSFSPTPPQKVWKAIHKQVVPWYKTLGFKITASLITLAVITIAIITGLSPWPNKQAPAQSIVDSQYTSHTITIRQPHSPIGNQPQKTANTYNHKRLPTPTTDTSEKHDFINTTQQKPQHIVKEQKFSYSNPFSQRKLNLDITIYPHTGCEPLTVTFSVRPPENMDISWFIDKQIVSESKTFQYTLNKGTHFIQLAIFDSEQTILVYDTITVYPRPSAEFEADRCKAGDTLNLRNLSLNAQKYSWSFGDGKTDTCHSPLHVFSSQGLYNITLIASNKYCSDTVSHLVAIEPGEKAILFPNAFIPDVSGPSGGYYNPNKPVSNIFHPVVRKPVKTYELKIFDRRGKLIFHTTDINQGWDGYYRNKLVPVGVYIFVAQGTFTDGQPFTVKGDITVIYKR